MKKTLRRVSPIQFGKVLGVFYAFMSLLMVPFILIFGQLGSLIPSLANHSATSAPAIPFPLLGVGFSLMMAILFPIMYGAMGFIFGLVSAWGYNWIAKWVGGIEVEVD